MAGWIAAVVLGCAGTVGGMWAWARLEARLFDDTVDRGTPLPPRQAERQARPRQDGGWLPPGEEGHRAAAVALEAALVQYREECDRRAAAASAARPERRLPAVIDVGPGTQI